MSPPFAEPRHHLTIRSSAPQLEVQILDEVGSYGRQFGRTGEALECW